MGPPAPSWDDVIIGAGSSGTVLASRLSERPDRRVLLLEAGPDEPSEATEHPAGPVLEGSNWDYEAFIGADPGGGRTFPYRVGKLVGGSSAVNAAIALRGLQCDFEAWAAAGNDEWCWSKVLPYFVKIETDEDYGGRPGSGHGSTGPIPVCRRPAGELDAVSIAFWRACRSLGLQDLADLNDGSQVGVGRVPTNTRAGQRMSTAQTYLAAARERPNLEVWAGTQVRRVIFEDRRAVGVEVLRDGQRLELRAGRVTLSAGAVNTPVILLRSGLGPAHRVAGSGVRAVADLPGVGENLVDHPTMAIWSVQRPDARPPNRSEHSVMARVALCGAAPDVSITLANNVAIPNMPGIGPILGDRVSVSVAATLLDPVSRGSVGLAPGAPDGRPVITLGLATDPGDLERLMLATRFAWSLVRASPLTELLGRAFGWTDRMVQDDALLRAAVPRFVSPMWHPAGTARMGPEGDAMAVVDQFCRVYQVEGLHIVDASVMPSIPSATPNLTCIMIAERVAGWMDSSSR